MDRNRTVAGLDVHKDSIYLCIMGHDEAIIFEKTYAKIPIRSATAYLLTPSHGKEARRGDRSVPLSAPK